MKSETLPVIGSRRRAGLLLHLTSLAGEPLGPAADELMDWLGLARQQVWQVLPVHPAGAFGSPYDARSAFALDPRLLSRAQLIAGGLTPSARAQDPPLHLVQSILDAITERRVPAGVVRRFEAFRHREQRWLEEWCLFAALGERFDSADWTAWPRPLSQREPAALARARRTFAAPVERHAMLQFLLREQWSDLRRRAGERGILLFGDLPIYIARDSADAWSRRELFTLDDDGGYTARAGVPPDYFSETGQLWGNPLYRWGALAATGYDWWHDRLATQLELYDLVRLDHFRGFVDFWEVPAGASTAVEGCWRPGPGKALFDALATRLGPLPLVAEDLGEITPEVGALALELSLPGMIVLQFGFGGDDDNPHALANHREKAVVYTGTHDNPPSRVWYRQLDRGSRARVRQALGATGRAIHADLVRAAYRSPARLAVIPAQDVLGLGEASRMNTPGVAAGNWAWRLTPGQLTTRHARRLRRLAAETGRAG